MVLLKYPKHTYLQSFSWLCLNITVTRDSNPTQFLSFIGYRFCGYRLSFIVDRLSFLQLSFIVYRLSFIGYRLSVIG